MSINEYIKIISSSKNYREITYDGLIIKTTNKYLYVKKIRSNDHNIYYIHDRPNLSVEELKEYYDKEVKENNYFLYGRYYKKYKYIEDDLNDESYIKIYKGHTFKISLSDIPLINDI